MEVTRLKPALQGGEDVNQHFLPKYGNNHLISTKTIVLAFLAGLQCVLPVPAAE